MNKQLSVLTVFLLIILLAPAPAFATSSITSLDVQDILTRLQKVLNPLMVTLLSFSFLSGIFFIFRALVMLKSFSLPITQQSKPGELTGPLVYFFVGTVLIYIPTSTSIISNTIFGGGQGSIFSGGSGQGFGSVDLKGMGNASDTIMAFAPVAIESQWATMINTIVLYMEFIGFIAFLRGWFILSHAGQGGQPGSISKGVIHIVGGILAINFLPLVNVIKRTILG